MAAIAGRTRRPDTGGVYGSLGGRVHPRIHQAAWDGAAAQGVSISLYLERLVEGDPLAKGKPTGLLPRRARVPSGDEVMLSGRVRPDVRENAKKGARARQVPMWRYLEILVAEDTGCDLGEERKPVAPQPELDLDLMSA